MSAAQQMQMQVMHGLPAIVPSVHDDPVTVVQLLFTRNLSCCSHKMAHQRRILGQSLCRRADVLLGNDQQMRGGLGIDIGEADAEFVFVDAAGGNSAVDDLAKKAVGRGSGTQLNPHGRKYFGCCPVVQGL